MDSPKHKNFEHTKSEEISSTKLETHKTIHDLGNNLMLLWGLIDSLKMEEANEYNKTILHNINHTRRIINELIKDLFCSEKQNLQKKATNIQDLITDTIGTLPKNKKNHIQITCPETAIVNIDPKKMELAIQNILINALHAINGNGEISIDVSKHNPSENKKYSYIKILIKDDGKGMTQETVKQIFQPYYTTKKEGKGLGLAIVKEIIDKHAGKIDVDSTPGKGTTFSIYLPTRNTAVKKTENNEKIKTEHIIIIDDDPVIITINKRFAEEMGINLSGANNSKEALKIIETAPPTAVVLLDQTMKHDIKGTELAKIIREKRPDLHIILCTGHNCENFEKYIEEGIIDNVLQKPYTLEDLQKLI